MLYLRDKLKPDHYTTLQTLFPKLDLSKITIEYLPNDGKLGSIAYVQGSVFKASTCIFLDNADWEDNRLISPCFELEGLVVCHELVHCEQTLTFWNRVRMWWHRIMKPYEKRWHEIEAHQKDEILLAEWKSLIGG